MQAFADFHYALTAMTRLVSERLKDEHEKQHYGGIPGMYLVCLSEHLSTTPLEDTYIHVASHCMIYVHHHEWLTQQV